MMVGHGFIRHAQHEDKPRRRPAANRGASDVVVVDRAPGAGRAGALLADTFPSFLCDRQTLAVAIGGARAPRGMMARRARLLAVVTHAWSRPEVQGSRALAVRPMRLHMEAGMALSFSLSLSSHGRTTPQPTGGGGTCLTMMGLGRSRAPAAANHVRRGFQNSDGGRWTGCIGLVSGNCAGFAVGNQQCLHELKV